MQICYQFIIYMAAVSMVAGRSVIKDRLLWITEEEINNIRFVHRLELREGRRTDRYSIAGSDVTADVFEEALLDAEKEERREQRKREESARLADIWQRNTLWIQTQRRLIEQYVQDIVRDHELLCNNKLLGYRSFRSDGITGEEDYDYCVHDLAQGAHNTVEDMIHDDNEVYQKVQLYSELLEQYRDNMHRLRHDTLQRAIDTCTDTQFLKEVLTLVS